MQTKASGKLITSKTFLSQRIQANRNSLRDFDAWCVQQLPFLPMDGSVLDLGCGNGKQLHLFSSYFSKKMKLYGMDLSVDSLSQLKDSYKGSPSLALVEGNFDQEKAYESLPDASLDLIYACYALYYTKDLDTLLRLAHQKLKPGGIFWVVGPSSGTNHQFLDILRPLHEVEPFMDYVFDDFMPEVTAGCQVLGYHRMKPALLRNEVYFPDAEAFLTYLRHSLFYRPGHDDAIHSAVQEVCAREGRFTVSKNVLSLQFEK